MQAGSVANSNYGTSDQYSNFQRGVNVCNLEQGLHFRLPADKMVEQQPEAHLMLMKPVIEKARVILEPNGLGTGYTVNVYLKLGADFKRKAYHY